MHAVQEPPYSIELPGAEAVAGETIPRRHPKARNGLLTRPAEDVSTIFDLVKRSAALYGGDPAIGSRKLLETHKEMKKVQKVVNGATQEVEKEWTYFEMSPYSFITYSEYETWTLELGSGLRKLGFQKGDKLHMFAATR